MTGRTGTDRPAGVLDVDAVFDGEFEQGLPHTAHQIPFGLIGLREALGVLEDELDGNGRWTVGMTGIAHVHESSRDAGTVKGIRCTSLAPSTQVIPCFARPL